jgi:hypothetical protein
MVDNWLFHPKKFLNFYTFCRKKIWVLSGCMQPKKEPWCSMKQMPSPLDEGKDETTTSVKLD